ncbi:MAG: DNA primase [Candidatus Diapherotrites archaeon]|nr:DNA primase [Candidatus Diapherotrites archaeon]
MGKIYVDSVKYVIHAKLEAKGLVDKPDVIGAIFGQTEGLLGGELELRELQKTGRIGRIEAKLERKNGRTYGEITVPSGLGIVETAIIAAALETIDRIGPTEAKISVEKIEDVRAAKRKYIVERARELLKRIMEEELPDSKEFINKVKEELRKAELREYGPERLPAGPEIDEAEEIIVVEGRADVINLLKHGIKNVIALNGNRVPKTIKELSKKKITTLFVDGDRGGDLIIRSVLEEADVDYVVKAPDGKEVEELTQKEILKALRRKVPAEEYRKSLEKKGIKIEKKRERREEKEEPQDPDLRVIMELRGSLEAILRDAEGKEILRVPVKELVSTIKERDDVHSIYMDGIITKRILEAAKQKGVKKIVGIKLGPTVKPEDFGEIEVKTLS